MAWIPLVWFQQKKQPFVTPGNRAAAVVGGFNVIVFSTIALLHHREKLAKKRNNQVPATPDSSEPQTPIDELKGKDISVAVASYPPRTVETQ